MEVFPIISETRRILPVGLIFVLSLLGLPRVLAHDLHWVDPHGPANLMLAILPPIIWILVVLRRKPARPFLNILLIGISYGILLAAIHQVLWYAAFSEPPHLNGRFSDLSPAAMNGIARISAMISSLLTGLTVGAVTGIIGLTLSKIIRT